jgi:hypothetical protein
MVLLVRTDLFSHYLPVDLYPIAYFTFWKDGLKEVKL